jgi:hypothetical protein
VTYVEGNPKTKKAIKDAIAAGTPMYVFEPGLGKLPPNGAWVYIEGPHYPEPHRWYAQAQIDASGRILKVK